MQLETPRFKDFSHRAQRMRPYGTILTGSRNGS